LPEKKVKPAPALSDRPLGDTQLNVLRALRDHQGRWHSSCGWYWSTDSGTRRILETLVQRCLVDKEGEGYRATYTINRSGLEALKQGRLI
jgi:hypothetical protein